MCQDHITLTRALLSTVLLGHSNIWSTPDFQAFKDRFNLQLDSKISFIKVCQRGVVLSLPSTHNCSILDTLFMTARKPLKMFSGPAYDPYSIVLSMSNRAITSTSQLFRHVQFAMTDHSGSYIKNRLFYIFQYRFLRYLLGSGHPDHPLLRGTFTPASDHTPGDELLCVWLLLLAVSDLDLMPVDRDWVIMVIQIHTFIIYFIYSLEPL